MFTCVSIYLQAGIRKTTQTDKLKRKTIRTAYGDEFLEWFMDYTDPKNGHLGQPVMQMALYNSFVGENGFSGKDYSVKRFKSGLVAAGKLLGIPMKFEKLMTGRQVVIGEKVMPGLNGNPAFEIEKSVMEEQLAELPF